MLHPPPPLFLRKNYVAFKISFCEISQSLGTTNGLSNKKIWHVKSHPHPIFLASFRENLKMGSYAPPPDYIQKKCSRGGGLSTKGTATRKKVIWQVQQTV